MHQPYTLVYWLTLHCQLFFKACTALSTSCDKCLRAPVEVWSPCTITKLHCTFSRIVRSPMAYALLETQVYLWSAWSYMHASCFNLFSSCMWCGRSSTSCDVHGSISSWVIVLMTVDYCMILQKPSYWDNHTMWGCSGLPAHSANTALLITNVVSLISTVVCVSEHMYDCEAMEDAVCPHLPQCTSFDENFVTTTDLSVFIRKEKNFVH